MSPGGCANCGASLSLEQLRGTNCPFCNKVFPHHGRAVEQAALVNQVLAGQVSQAATYQAQFVNQIMGGQLGPMGQAGQPGAPPQISIQYGAAPPQAFNPYAQLQQQTQQTITKSLNRTILIVVVLAVLVPLIGAGVAIATVFL
jgi:hypothetical protein